MSELISLLDLTTTLSSGLTVEEILDAALLIVMGEFQASRGCLLVRSEAGGYEIRASRGLPAGAPSTLPLVEMQGSAIVTRPWGPNAPDLEALGLEVLCPILKGGRPIAALGLGPRAGGGSYGEQESAFLRSVASCAATPIENGLMYHELRQLNRRLSVKVFQLNNLFDISRELTTSFDEASIQSLVTATLMGHLMVSRCALFLKVAGGFALAHARGLRSEEEGFVDDAEAAALTETLKTASLVTELPSCRLRERLLAARMALVVPLGLSGRVEGLLAVGERVAGGSFSEEDKDFAMTLARQAQAALESVRLHRVRVEKQRQDREMQIAREIQQSLFPRTFPRVEGFDVAAESHACHEVGGDHFDVIPLQGGRVALAIADVSGKGAPASLLMASVHAWLRALAGSAPPATLAERLNRFLFENTQANRFVTLFYGELDPASRRLAYVNAGHIPPYWVPSEGRLKRLTEGGPVLGLIEDASFEQGEAVLAAADRLAMVTDGVTEAQSPDEEEFGDARVADAFLGTSATSAAEAVASLVRTVNHWIGEGKPGDDLTVLVLLALGSS
jgi:sigma-B regulation protein RsbU (phosphoserine phosphatase)